MHDAPAKLTLSLRVTGVRHDGYHLLDAEMVTLEYGDRLEFGPGDGLEVTGPRAWGVPVSDANLVRRALAAVGRTAHVRLEKHVPAGAGLGGGSADAAAVLRWAGSTDLELAARLGADVPFCVVGGRARVTGIGDVVEPLPFEPRTFTLLLPPFGTVTRGVYRVWDHLGGPTATEPGGNDLETAVLAMAPELARWRDELGEASGHTPRLAGSGSAWFVEGEFPGGGRIVTRARPGFADEA
ncbi:MAG TPA: 4-(cytidine 5'-diphospho)-2-C-methyl-D-erythritol kinase [Acidimicrobiales bacterium]|nr:4-(cytidine 5'-diphospho)-2-C-methyl-D-erythritol kinase [Acidimicrobiales bacterium]